MADPVRLGKIAALVVLIVTLIAATVYVLVFYVLWHLFQNLE